MPECLICEDKFTSEEEYIKNVAEHLDIDIEYLKNGHKVFE